MRYGVRVPDWLIFLLCFAAGELSVVALWRLVLEVRWRRALAADAQAKRDERAADIAWMDEIEARARASVDRIMGDL